MERLPIVVVAEYRGEYKIRLAFDDGRKTAAYPDFEVFYSDGHLTCFRRQC